MQDRKDALGAHLKTIDQSRSKLRADILICFAGLCNLKRLFVKLVYIYIFPLQTTHLFLKSSQKSVIMFFSKKFCKIT